MQVNNDANNRDSEIKFIVIKSSIGHNRFLYNNNILLIGFKNIVAKCMLLKISQHEMQNKNVFIILASN